MPTLTDRIGQIVFDSVSSAYTDNGLALAELNYVLRAGALFQVRDDQYRQYARYYSGHQDDPREIEFGDRRPGSPPLEFHAPHNFCVVVVDVVAERLSVIGLNVTGDGLSESAAADLAAQLWAWWQAGRMDETQVNLHAMTLVYGDSYLIVDYDAAAGRPRWTYHDALTITPVYDAHGTLIRAYKVWEEKYTDEAGQERARRRATRYTPALIEKFYQDNNGRWAIWANDLDSEGRPDGGVIDWTQRNGEPIGIPVVHFRNKPRGEDYGRSELHDVIPIQDEYNRRVWNTSEGMAFAGNLQKYVIGAMPPGAGKPTDGREPYEARQGGWVSGPGTVWSIQPMDPDKGATAGYFPPSDIAALQDATDRELKTLAAQTRVPMHLIWPEGPLPSGEALKTSEAGLVFKCHDRAIVYGNKHEDAMKLAIRLHNTFGAGGALAEDVTISAQWAPFATRSELSESQTTATIREDISREEALRRAGYSPEDITKILAEREANAEVQAQALSVERQRVSLEGDRAFLETGGANTIEARLRESAANA